MQRDSRLRFLLWAVPTALLVLTVGYLVGMPLLEGEERSIIESLQWATETLTTTGYGRDTVWRHPVMAVFVVISQFLGVAIIYLIIPVALLPFLESRFETRLPREVAPMENHIVVYGYGPAVASLLRDAADSDVPTLLIEPREEVARRQLDAGQAVIVGSLDEDVLERSHLGEARAVLGNGTDAENSELVVGVRQLGFEGPVICLVEHPLHRRPITLAGASAAITPRHALGAALAAIASRRISPTVSGIQTLGGAVGLVELRVENDSPLAGKTLREAEIGERTGASVLGQWVGGELRPLPTAETVVEPGGILVVAGSKEALIEVEDLCEGAVALRPEGHFVVAGCGEVGRKVAQLLTDAGERVVTIDREPGDRVDLVADLLQPNTAERADCASARGIVVALNDDTTSLFATVLLREAAPEATILARVNNQRNVEKLHRAGADMALSLGQVAGQILAGHLLGERSISIDPQLKLLRVEALKGLEQRSLGELRVRQRTGASVVAVEREGEVLVDLGEDFCFVEGDVPYVCGSREATAEFRKLFES